MKWRRADVSDEMSVGICEMGTLRAQKHRSLQEFSTALAKRETYPTELVEEALARAAGSPNAFIPVRRDAVLKEAEQSNARWREGNPLSPLDGIPIAWKELFDIKGTITTAGSRAIASDARVAERDAPVVANTRRLGLLPIGKTNLSELAYSGLGLNLHFGTPGDRLHVPGDSSSGSAVAVKEGVVAAAIGIDTAGSIRIPAAFNGLMGFKASPSRYDMTAVFPLAHSFDSLGPICLTVADCVIMDAAMRGEGKPNISPATTPPKFIVDIGVLENPELTEGVRDNFTAFIGRLIDAGAGVENRRVVAVERSRKAIDDAGWLGAVEANVLHQKLLVGPSRELLDPRIVARLEAAKSLGTTAVAMLRASRAELIGYVARELDGAILLMPTVKHVAPRLLDLEADATVFAKVNLATLSLTMIGSFLNMPVWPCPRAGASGWEHPRFCPEPSIATKLFSLPPCGLRSTHSRHCMPMTAAFASDEKDSVAVLQRRHSIDVKAIPSPASALAHLDCSTTEREAREAWQARGDGPGLVLRVASCLACAVVWATTSTWRQSLRSHTADVR